MRIQQPHWLIIGSLTLALVATACDGTGVRDLPPVSVVSPAPSRAPATAAPTATQPSSSPVPAATATALPAATATAILVATATAEPAVTPEVPTAEPIALLPAGQPWVRSGGTITALGVAQRKLNLGAAGFPPLRYGAVAAPDGMRIAYVSEQDRLVVVDMSGGVRTLPDGRNLNPIGFSFSPDGRALAFTVTDGQRWQLQAIDLQSGAVRTLQEGSHSAPAGGSLPLALRPIAWTPAGILADRILWASDAPPQGLAMINPADGSLRAVRGDAHLLAAPSPDGTKIAVVTGDQVIGMDQLPTMEMRVFDASSGSETVIAAKQPGFVREPHWSPDGAMLLYAVSETYDSPVTSIIAVNADGTNKQRVDFGVKGLEMTFQDLAWLDSQTALVLAGNAGGQLELDALPIGSFDPTGLRPLGTFEGQPDADHQILYVPGGD